MSAGGGAGQARKSFSVIKVIRGLPKTVIAALSIPVEDVVTSCLRCGGPVRHGEEFCSQYCAVNYWGRLRQANGKASGMYINIILIILIFRSDLCCHKWSP
jgi:predicted nucleic acid-binding Zn ribbon protein